MVQFSNIKKLAEKFCYQNLIKVSVDFKEIMDNEAEDYGIYISGSFVAACVALARYGILKEKNSTFSLRKEWRHSISVYDPEYLDAIFNSRGSVEENGMKLNIFKHYNIGDLDIYFKNKARALSRFVFLTQRKIDKIIIDAVNVVFDDIIDIMKSYDSYLVKCAFSLKEKELVGYDELYEKIICMEVPEFPFVSLSISSVRYDKVKRRARGWFGGTATLDDNVKSLQLVRYQSGEKKIYNLPSAGCIHINEWYGNRRCIGCQKVFSGHYNNTFQFCAFTCDGCLKNVNIFIKSFTDNILKGKNILVIGGKKGIGKLIVERALKKGAAKVKYTTRYPNVNNPDEIRYNIEDIEINYLDEIINADIIIFNAWPTAEGDSELWTHTIEDYPFCKHEERSRVVMGYINFMKKIAIHINTNDILLDGGRRKRREFVMIDAEETKYHNKIGTGRHLICNITKSGQKMITATLAEMFIMLNVHIMYYDPGWIGAPEVTRYIGIDGDEPGTAKKKIGERKIGGIVNESDSGK